MFSNLPRCHQDMWLVGHVATVTATVETRRITTFFVVDVWNENSNKWSDLKNLLVGGLRGSKVLVTTRNEKVADITSTASSYFLVGISKSNSWDLFKKMAFKDGEEPKNPKLAEIGREIVQKCARVPLAIRSIGSLLYFKNSLDEWLYFKNNGREYFMDLL
jgi:hypothetical protein